MRGQFSRIPLLLFILIITPTHVICNHSSSRFFILHTGFWLPFDSGYRDDWAPGPSIGLGIGYQLNDNVSVIGTTSYARFNYVGSTLPGLPFDAMVLGFDGSKKTFCTIVELKHAPNNLKAKLHPYMKGGLGYFSEDISKMEVTYRQFYRNGIVFTDFDSRGMIADGMFFTYSLGVDLGFSNNLSSFFEVKFLFDLSDSDMPYLPIIGGVRF